jgi:hypothetical protein
MVSADPMCIITQIGRICKPESATSCASLLRESHGIGEDFSFAADQ